MSTGRIFKRGRVWWIQYNVNGRQYRESAKTTRKEDAQTLLRRRHQEIWEGSFFPGARRLTQKTVGQLRDEWLKEKAGKRSLEHDRQRLGRFVDHVGEHRALTTITTDEAAGFLATLAESAPATRNRYRAVIRGAFNFASRRGFAHRDPMRGIEDEPERNARNRVCSPAEYVRLRDAAQGDLRAFIVVGYWLGMREGEIAQLDAKRLDIKAGTIRFSGADTKEGAIKTLPLPAEVVAELKALPSRIDGRVFAYTAQTYSNQFAALCRELKINDLHFHDLRHTALTNMGEAGVDVRTMMAFSGHKTMAMLLRYVHASPSRLRSAMAQVEAHAAGRDSS